MDTLKLIGLLTQTDSLLESGVASDVTALSDLQLTLVGGGIGDVVHG